MGVSGKIVAITGASSGIGRATALLLAERGAKLVLGARRQEQLDDLVAEIAERGGEAVRLVTDVSKRADVEALVALAGDRYGRLDVLVSNAGIGPIALFDQADVEDWEAMIDVNVKGVLYGIAAALPMFRRQDSGHFVNVISTAGLRIVPSQGVYAATKNAVRTITEGLRQEAGAKLRVTGVSPGVVRTDFAGSIRNQTARDAVTGQMADTGIPPDAIARAIAFAIEQPAEVEVGDIVVRPTAQS
ncbi:SDR family oxidoreductase [Azospirillum picis]|uniref:SDR family oxidoreductase n=1 Tax=Azospirillum picis TaxID=488438 RepID=UPI001AE536EB|nr:SDR family oxidoreductase [Azospirillum picis]